ncbi:MAG: polysaccharide deacetylase family protein [Bacteroidales bacterium]|nr:polysaccharide deacetylase family protein [Bacteroidales bacterium]
MIITFSILIFLFIVIIKKSWIWHIFHREKVIYLTFDDGPQEELTQKILQILQQEDIKATFFCVGDAARRYPHIMEQIREQGHSIGNHTMHHLNGWRTPHKEYIQDIQEAQNYLHARYFRPPYGKITLRQWRALRKDYHIIFWTDISYDWSPKMNPKRCFKKVRSAARHGGIVVFHDNPKAAGNMLEALPLFIHSAKENGMTFKTFD